MKKHILLCTNLIICLIIVVGFAGTTFIGHLTYTRILEDDIENISKLTSSNIYAEIDSELTKPIFVAQTMASDSFLKQWLYDEKLDASNETNAKNLQEYLYAYREKYQYDAVYMISSSSNIYYYYDGVNKIVSPENAHDEWYYDFLASGDSYRLNIDSDEVNHNELTVFVDCRVESPDGELLGVTGVGVKMSRLQELLGQHETEYHLQALLINGEGKIQVDTDSSKIGTANFFDEYDVSDLKEIILQNQETMEMHWYPEGQMDNCLITRYIENLDWYLVVQKNTQVIRSSFQELVRKDLLLIVIMLALFLSLSTIVIRRYNKRMVKALNTDSLTSLPNQQSFNDSYNAAASAALKAGGAVLFLFDIDRFKRINDTKGHLFGNKILASVASIARAGVDSSGLVARWGGDEFIGTINASPEQAEKILREIQEEINVQCSYDNISVTISTGFTRVAEGKSLDELIAQADQALYRSKEQGGNLLTDFSALEPAKTDQS